MKYIILLLILSALFAACRTQRCYPSPGSKDWAIEAIKTDGGWLVKYRRYHQRWNELHECLPSSFSKN